MSADACVVVPTLGTRTALLSQCLRSITSQRAGSRPVVVAPADRCPELEPLVAAAGGVLLAQTGRGQSAAINQGWAERGSGSRWLTWLGDDDLLEPGSLRRCITALEQDPTASMVCGAVRYIDLHGGPLFVFRPPTAYGPRLLRYGHNLLQQPGSLLRRTAVEQVGPLDVNLRFAMDLDLFLRLSTCGRILRVSDVLASFRWHSDSLTAGQGEASSAEAEAVRRSHRPRRAVEPFLATAAGAITQVQYWRSKR